MAKSSPVKPSLELGLDFSNTVDWRNGEKPEDGLNTFDGLLDWSVKMGLIQNQEAGMIRQSGDEEDKVLRKAIKLRETIYRIFSAVAHDEHPDDDDLTWLNDFLSGYPVTNKVVRKGQQYGWAVNPGKGTEGKMLWPIAKSAADLLTSDQLGRVTECANEEEGCGWVFLDKTKSGTKKWCSSSGCGNRAKVRAWYERHERARS